MGLSGLYTILVKGISNLLDLTENSVNKLHQGSFYLQTSGTAWMRIRKVPTSSRFLSKLSNPLHSVHITVGHLLEFSKNIN